MKIISLVPSFNPNNEFVSKVIEELKKVSTIILFTTPVMLNMLSNINKIDFFSLKPQLHLMNTEPLWDLLEQDDFSNLLFHVNGHGNVLRAMKPTSIEQLASVLAVIRPAKRHLIGKDWNTVMSEVWVKPENDEYYFKKSHAIAYATAIVVQMNLICEGISYGYN